MTDVPSVKCSARFSCNVHVQPKRLLHQDLGVSSNKSCKHARSCCMKQCAVCTVVCVSEGYKYYITLYHAVLYHMLV